MSPHASETGFAILMEGQVNLELSLTGLGMLGKDVKYEGSSINNLDLSLVLCPHEVILQYLLVKCILQPLLLPRGQLNVKHYRAAPILQEHFFCLLHLPSPYVCSRVRLIHSLRKLASQFQPSRLHQLPHLRETLVQAEVNLILLGIDRADSLLLRLASLGPEVLHAHQDAALDLPGTTILVHVEAVLPLREKIVGVTGVRFPHCTVRCDLRGSGGRQVRICNVHDVLDGHVGAVVVRVVFLVVITDDPVRAPLVITVVVLLIEPLLVAHVGHHERRRGVVHQAEVEEGLLLPILGRGGGGRGSGRFLLTHEQRHGNPAGGGTQRRGAVRGGRSVPPRRLAGRAGASGRGTSGGRRELKCAGRGGPGQRRRQDQGKAAPLPRLGRTPSASASAHLASATRCFRRRC
mmetsp:Transcript_8371/g.17761  ORF Transcript_8371/g.17761 Transcript_8371/m.17761 type:complete len:406 (-) Transcript_8371:326-1543(-)